MVTAQTFCNLMTAVYGGFGFTMFPMVNFFYGPESPIAYFTETSEFQTFFARAVGLLFIMIVLGPYVFGVPFEAAAKQYLVWNSLSLPLFIQAAFYLKTAGPGVNAVTPFNMWIPQIAIGVVFLILNILVVFTSPPAKKGKAKK
jgi:hypothetical protein